MTVVSQQRTTMRELSDGIDHSASWRSDGMLINRQPDVLYNSAIWVPWIPTNTFVFGAAAYNNAGAVNDGFAYYDYVVAGATYTLELAYGVFSASAKITCDISYDGGTTWLTLDSNRDTYSASLGSIQATITGIIPPSTGKCLLRFRALSKNAASSQYFMYLSQARLRRTA